MATSRLVPPALRLPNGHGHQIVSRTLGEVSVYTEGEGKRPEEEEEETTNAFSLAGGVKGDVSWLLGDQSESGGKISGPKPAGENLPA
ncbi:hypothetical protein F2P81_017573 [Scophthalmus maximus]|uniref:Uncharacterized protein n=1 Tax=Scophthalmus maximus TaxID=52904 RepID=A0A6A4SKF5_SCOMX|nr:hypothetical protein F2P81_017573 [Scophthalmus maximus]